jgi:hypothetical protein
MKVLLSEAVLCVDCEVISSRTVDMICTNCGSSALLLLSTILGTISSEDAARLKLPAAKTTQKGLCDGR